MVIPSNLLTVNNPIRLDATEQILPTASVGGLPNNLLRINTSEISASFQSHQESFSLQLILQVTHAS